MLSSSQDFSSFFTSGFLSDCEVELVESSGKRTASIKAHAILLSRASPLLRELISLKQESEGENEGGGAHKAHERLLRLPVPGSLEGGKLTLEAIYNPSCLATSNVQPELLVSVLLIADALQADVVMLAAAHALQYAASTSSPTPGTMSEDGDWPWSVVRQILDLPTTLLNSQFCRPLLLRAQERLVAAFADLEAAWQDPYKRAQFLELPTDAVEVLFGSPDLQAASENTCFVAMTDYVERGRGQHAPPEQLAHLASLLRLQHLSPSFFLDHALPRPWLTQAAAAQECTSGYRLFHNPCFQPSSSPTPPPTTSPANSGGAAMGAGASASSMPPASARSPSSGRTTPTYTPGCTHGAVHSILATNVMAHDLSSNSEVDSELSGSEPVLPLPPSLRSARGSSGSGSSSSSHKAQPSCLPSLHGVRLPDTRSGAGSCRSGSGDASCEGAQREKGVIELGAGAGAGSAVEEELRGALHLCTQYASFVSGHGHTAKTAGAFDWSGFLPTSTLALPPRALPTSSFSSLLDAQARKWGTRPGTGVLQLEVPLHRLRRELEMMGWMPPQAGSYLNRLASQMGSSRAAGAPSPAAGAAAASAGATGHSTTTVGRDGCSPSDLCGGCTSSANLVASPTIVWAGYVWAMDVFVARDPDFVLGLSVHALYPAFGLPTASSVDPQDAFSAPPRAASVVPASKLKSAVAAQMLLSVYDVELQKWVALYPKAINTNTGLEQYLSSERNPARPTAQPNAAPGSREEPTGPPHFHPYYGVTYTDYYPVWTSSGINHIVADSNSWQRHAYAPEGRILLRAELVHCA